MPVLQAVDHELYAAAALYRLVVSGRFYTGFPNWDAGLEALGFRGIWNPPAS